MKKLLLFILLLNYTTNKAQTWCPPGAEWYYGAYATYPSANGYFKYIYTNDTIVSSTVYKKINSYFFGYNQMSGPFFQITYLNSYFSHENNNVVFFNNDTLYNFNANIGDKWLRMQIKNNFIPNTFCDAPRRPVEVIDTGHVIINSTYLKSLTLKYQLKYVETSSFVPLTTYTDVVYQRIGSIGMAFSPERCEFMNPGTVLHPISSTGFRCYSDNTFASYSLQTYSLACNYIPSGTSLTENSNNLFFLFYPNPVNELLTIDISAEQLQLKENAKLEILNSLGQIIQEEAITFKENKAVINTKELANGVYVLILSSRGTRDLRIDPSYRQDDKPINIRKQFVIAR